MPDLGHKYDAGVIVTGEVAKLLTDLGTTFVDLEAGGAHRIALTFADRGATVRAKGVKLHDSIVVRCRLGEMGGPAQAILGACVLE